MLLHEGILRVVDIAAGDWGEMCCENPQTLDREATIPLPRTTPTSIAPFAGGRFLITSHMIGRIDIVEPSGRLVGNISHTVDGAPIPTPNDCTPDGQGGAFITSSGTFDRRAARSGQVMHVDPDLRVTTLIRGLHYANGIAYDPRTSELFVTEHFDRRIWRFVIGSKGEITDRGIVTTIAPYPLRAGETDFNGCGPDNLRLRQDGTIQVPMYGEGRILIMARDGTIRRTVNVPCRFVTDSEERADGAILFCGAMDLSEKPGRGLVGIAQSNAD
jgi:lactonase